MIDQAEKINHTYTQRKKEANEVTKQQTQKQSQINFFIPFLFEVKNFFYPQRSIYFNIF